MGSLLLVFGFWYLDQLYNYNQRPEISIWRTLQIAQNCTMALSHGWAFKKKCIFSKCSTMASGHDTVLNGRKGP